jgi:hypothetical protein
MEMVLLALMDGRDGGNKAQNENEDTWAICSDEDGNKGFVMNSARMARRLV